MTRKHPQPSLFFKKKMLPRAHSKLKTEEQLEIIVLGLTCEFGQSVLSFNMLDDSLRLSPQ